jgi:predicted cupin superfamily sugar epimerase
MENNSIAEEIIKKYNLVALGVEGGYFTETYRSKGKILKENLPPAYKSDRNFSTSILYLITPGNFSSLHKVASDEMFHFYMGDQVIMLNLFEDGAGSEVRLGSNIFGGDHLQHLVPKNTWQGAKLAEGGRYALLGTTVSPGFEFEDFISAKNYRDEILEKYPTFSRLINELIII